MFAPKDNPETLVLSRLAFAKIPDPETTVQIPPGAAVALRFVIGVQMFWTLPANTLMFEFSTIIETSSLDVAQTPFDTVHLNTLVPVDNPETEVFARFALAKVPVPEMTVHTPFPTVGALPSSVVTVAQIV
jgi:hypothetical protein